MRRPFIRTRAWLGFAIAMTCLYALLAAAPARAQETGQEAVQEYDILPHRGETYGHLSVSDGPALVESENQSVGNRFRLSLDLRLGDSGRYNVGWTLIDSVVSSENAASVGNVSRYGSGPNLGYFIIPDRLWVMYTFDINEVTGSRVTDSVTEFGHQLEVGYTFYSNARVDAGVQLSYLYLPSVSVPVYDVNLNATGSASYPSAQIISLSLVIGLEFD